MAKKATITPVTDTVNNASAINTQLNAINNQLNNTLSLDGSTPNAMNADIDLNSNDLLNVGVLQANDVTVAGDSLTGVLASTGANRDAAAASATSASLSATQAALYEGVWVDDVTGLLADTALTYTAGQLGTVVAGGYVRTRSEGFSYEVAAAAATDNHVVTSGGVKLYVVGDQDVKAFGAKGDGVADDTAEVTVALASGSSIHFSSGTYKVTADINVSSNTRISGDGIGKTIIAADLATNGGLFIHPVGVSNVAFSGITFRGNPTENGAGNKAFGVYVEGSNNISFDKCAFDTFTTHSLTIRKGDGTWIDGGVANSQTSVDALIAQSCTDVSILHCLFDWAGSNHLAVFGGNRVTIFGCQFSANTGGTDVLVDDASQTTALTDYSINNDVFIDHCVGTTVCRLDGCARGSVTNSIFASIKTRSYDFDQQKLNLTEPFFFLNYMPRDISISGNICNAIETRTGSSVTITGNSLTSASASAMLVRLGNNGLAWGGAVGSIWDNIVTTVQSAINQSVIGNTLSANHASIVGVSYDAINIQQTASAYSNTFTIKSGSFSSVVLAPNQSWMYSYTLGATHLDKGREYQAIGTAASNNLGFTVSQGASKFRAVGTTFQSDFALTSNYNPFSGAIDNASAYTFIQDFSNAAAKIRWGIGAINTAPTLYLTLDSGGNFYPSGVSGTQQLGRAATKWSEVFAATATINTSDERSKQDIRSLSEAERLVATDLKSMIKVYRFRDAVTAKGDKARKHIGLIAQEVQATFEKHGLDAWEYGLLCWDEWPDEYDEKGNLIVEAGEVYGLRDSELHYFILSVS